MEQILTVTGPEPAQPVAVLTAVGEIDHDSREVLHEAASAVFRRGESRLVIDLAGVSFCDSGGLSLFLDLHKTAVARGGSLRLACASPAVLSVVLATNLDRMLHLHPTVAEAVNASLAAG